jgi:hypothetical protein
VDSGYSGWHGQAVVDYGKGSKNGGYCEVDFYCPDYEYMGVIVFEVFARFGVVGGSLIVQKAAVLLVRSTGVGDMLDWRYIDNSG